MPENTVTLCANATRDGELTFANSGTAIASFGVAVNTRKKNAAGDWEDGDPQFYDIKAFGDLAENVAETVTKGMRVIVTGRLNFSSWEKDGERRSKVEVVADEIGCSLKWATATVAKTEKR